MFSGSDSVKQKLIAAADGDEKRLQGAQRKVDQAMPKCKELIQRGEGEAARAEGYQRWPVGTGPADDLFRQEEAARYAAAADFERQARELIEPLLVERDAAKNAVVSRKAAAIGGYSGWLQAIVSTNPDARAVLEAKWDAATRLETLTMSEILTHITREVEALESDESLSVPLFRLSKFESFTK